MECLVYFILVGIFFIFMYFKHRRVALKQSGKVVQPGQGRVDNDY